MATGWSVMDALNGRSKAAAEDKPKARFRTRDISIRKIYGSELNFYSMPDIEELAQQILAVGLLENLTVKYEPCERGEYRLIAGERRWRALKLLTEQGYEDFEMATCQILTPAEAHEETVQLILANAYRSKTVIDILEEEKRLKESLQYMKENGMTLKGYRLDSGRLRDVIAGIMNTTTTKIAQIESINKRLIPEFTEELKGGRLTFSAAYEVSGMAEDAQRKLLERHRESGLTWKQVKEAKEAAETESADQMEGQMEFSEDAFGQQGELPIPAQAFQTVTDDRKKELEENEPERCISGCSGSGLCGAAAYCSEPVRCCADCEISCNIRCGWLNREEVVSSLGQSEGIQQKDAAWFVKRFLEGRGKEYLPELMRICRKQNLKAEKAKEVKNLISPYGGHGGGSSEFGYNFSSYNQGIDFDAENWTQKIHMSYVKFVDIMMQIYDPFAPEWEEAEGKEAQTAAENPDETAGESLAMPQETETPVTRLSLMPLTIKKLSQAGIDTAEQLQKRAEDPYELMKIRNLSGREVTAIREALKAWENETDKTEIVSDCEGKTSNSDEIVPDLPEAASEVKSKLPTYDRGLLQKMITDEETVMDLMADEWLKNNPEYFTKHAMMIEAYHLLLDKHGEREEEE